MLRVLLCISCCSAPPPRERSAKRSANPDQLPNGTANKSSNQDAAKSQRNEDEETNEKDQLLTNQIQANNENYGTKSGGSQGKLTLAPGEESSSFDATKHDEQLIQGGADSMPTPMTKLQRAEAVDQGNSYRLGEVEVEFLSQPDDYSGSLLSSVEIGPFSESVSTTASHPKELAQDQKLAGANKLELPNVEQNEIDSKGQSERVIAPEQPYEPMLGPGVVTKNAPSTTKIGDYARIEYSPVEDLESLTTMSYSRLGSEKGGSHSRAGSTKTNTFDGAYSRRSSQGGVESTSISIASQLSNEQFQQNLTNMLESVNSNYQTIGVIGLPLGPPIEGTQTETTKTSPETPGAALTSASQESLSDAAFGDISPPSSRPGTLRSNASTGAALVGDSLERSNLIEELAEFAQPAPLATCEDEDQPQVVQANSNTSGNEPKAADRVGSPQSIATTTSGGLTNPTPTPSEMSGGSGKKKKLRAKALLKKLRPGSKKKNKDEPK